MSGGFRTSGNGTFTDCYLPSLILQISNTPVSLESIDPFIHGFIHPSVDSFPGHRYPWEDSRLEGKDEWRHGVDGRELGEEMMSCLSHTLTPIAFACSRGSEFLSFRHSSRASHPRLRCRNSSRDASGGCEVTTPDRTLTPHTPRTRIGSGPGRPLPPTGDEASPSGGQSHGRRTPGPPYSAASTRAGSFLSAIHPSIFPSPSSSRSQT